MFSSLYVIKSSVDPDIQTVEQAHIEEKFCKARLNFLGRRTRTKIWPSESIADLGQSCLGIRQVNLPNELSNKKTWYHYHKKHCKWYLYSMK